MNHVCFSEIKRNMDNVSFEGYRSHVLQRTLTRKGHVHGGLAILVKNQLRQGVKFLQSTSSEYQWFLLKKDFFGLMLIFMFAVFIFLLEILPIIQIVLIITIYLNKLT